MSDVGKWTANVAATGETGLRVSSNQLVSTNSTTATAWRNDQRYGPDTEVAVTIATKPGAGNAVRLYARLQTPGSSSYDAYWVRYQENSGTDQVFIERVDASVVTTLATLNQEFAAGDKLKIRVIGSSIQAWRSAGSSWSEVGEVNDSTYTGGGYVGVGLRGTTGRLDDFAAASLSPAPTPDPAAVLDDFNRGSENPLSDGGKWSNDVLGSGGESGLRLLSNQLACSYTTTRTAWWNDQRYGPDAAATVTIATKPGVGNAVRLYARLQMPGFSSFDAYEIRFVHNAGVDQVLIERVDASAFTTLKTIDQEFAAGDELKIRVVGSSIQAWRYDGYGWSELGEVNDTTYSSAGYVGVGLRGTSGRLEDFRAASLSPPPIADPTPVLDGFNRADEALSDGGKWTTNIAATGETWLRVSSNQLVSTNTTTATAWRNDQRYGPDQFAAVTIARKPGVGNVVRLYARLQSPGTSGYDGYALWYLHNAGTDQVLIDRIDNGAYTVLTTLNQEFADYDELKIRTVGASIQAWRYDGYNWSELGEATDSTYPDGGYIGVGLRNIYGRLDDFRGGGGGGTGDAGSLPPAQSYGSCDGVGVHALAPTACTADPVNSLTGAFTDSETDLTLPGIGVSFDLERSYTSADTRTGRLGPGWSDSYSASLQVQPSGDVLLHGEDGQQVYYTKQPDGSFTGAPGARSILTTVSSGYKLLRHDQVSYHFDTQGRLTSVLDRNGQGVTLAYDGNGHLATVTDASGRVATFTSNPDGALAQVSLPDGRSVSYGYTNGRLTSVTDPANHTTSYHYDNNGRLDQITDPNGHTQVQSVYGSDGRVTQQTDALGHTTTFSWDAATQTATATDARGHEWKDVYASNILTKRIDALGNATQFGTDGDLNTTSVTAPDGERTSMAYDSRGNLTAATAPASLGSAQKTFTYDGQNNRTSVTDARGKVTGYAYDAAGNLSAVTHDGQPAATYTYTAAGQPASRTDGNGHTTGYSYDAHGNLSSSTDPLGDETTYRYDAAGNLIAQTDPNGNVAGANPDQFTRSYTYDAAGLLRTETDALGNTTSYGYDPAGNLTSATDANDHTTSYSYDAANRLTSLTALGGATSTFTYDAAGNQLTRTDANNHTTSYAYDADNRLLSTTSPLGNKTSYAYDANGNRSKQVNARGNAEGADPAAYTTTYAYDAAGRLLSETDPLGHTTSYGYDSVGDRTTVTDPNNHTTHYAYDAKNRLVSETQPDGGLTSYAYDAEGNLRTRTDPNGHTTSYGYDDANRLTSVTTPLGNKTSYSYDANGDRIRQVDARGNAAGATPSEFTTSYDYDADGRLLSETDPLGHNTRYTHDAVGNLASVEDANGHTTAYSYDGADRLFKVTAPDLSTTKYTYDPVGNMVTRTDGNDHVTSYGYDADDRRTQITSPTGQTWTSRYDPVSNLSATVDANGNATATAGDGTTSYTYDAANRLKTIDYSDSTADVSFSYDGAGNRTAMSDGDGAETSTYDAANRLTQVTRGPDAFTYAYDPAGNLTQRTYPDGTSADYSYDADARLATVTSDGHTTSYAYDAAGNLLQTTLPSGNGYVATRTYDRAGRLTDLTNARGSSILSEFAYTLDPVGNPTEIIRTGSAPETTTFSYDSRDRLTAACFQASCSGGSDPLIRWTYDDVGNRLAEARPEGTTTYSYDAADELTHAGNTDYAYDANGNETQAGQRTFSYDLANRLTSTSAAGVTTSYGYDGDGNRLSTTSGSDTIHYLWDRNNPLPQLALERDGAGTLLRRYLYGLRRISMAEDGALHYYLYDVLGSVADLTSSTGTAEWTYAYDPFGATTTETQDDPAAPTNPYQFAGEQLDPTGLYYLRARQYDPAAGRFLQPDPKPQPDTEAALASYTYAADRPQVLVDPSGQRFHPPQASQSAAGTAASPSVPWDLYCGRHNMALLATVIAVTEKFGPAGLGIEWDNCVPGAGRNGGNGYPDILLRRGMTRVWDVKPNSPSGRLDGERTIKRYLAGLAKTEQARPGDRLPDRPNIPVSFNESVDVHSGPPGTDLAGVELYDVRSEPRWPAIEPVRDPALDTHRFRIRWKRGLAGASVVTASVGMAILAPEVDAAGWTIARVTAAFGG